jgi:hypothetical protein
MRNVINLDVSNPSYANNVGWLLEKLRDSTLWGGFDDFTFLHLVGQTTMVTLCYPSSSGRENITFSVQGELGMRRKVLTLLRYLANQVLADQVLKGII